MSLRSDLMELTYPIHNLFNWNFGFTIYRPENLISYRDFYGKPFSDRLWHCLYVMAIFCSILFYFFKRWEIRLVKVPPIDAVLYSRRGAYFTFFMFAYLIYTFYTSNLLCHLVNDKDSDIDVDMILNSDLDCVILEDVMWIIRNNIAASQNGNNMSENFKKVFDMKSVTILEGLKAIKSGNTALLSDYDTLQPFIRLDDVRMLNPKDTTGHIPVQPSVSLLFSFGFTIYRPENHINYIDIYDKPFTHKLWHCLYGMVFFCSILFYIFKRWEIRLVT
ncbi:putative ionotropic receptor IR2, partial [Operophtera brumata]